mgnify:CR=1 FL=1
MIYRISKEFHFSMGHALNHYEGDCHNVHGHNYRLVVTMKADRLDENGFVMDFKDLKNQVNQIIIQDLDHKFLFHKEDKRKDLFGLLDGKIGVDYEPTAENIVTNIANGLLHNGLTGIDRIELWETPTSSAIWINEEN